MINIFNRLILSQNKGIRNHRKVLLSVFKVQLVIHIILVHFELLVDLGVDKVVIRNERSLNDRPVHVESFGKRIFLDVFDALVGLQLPAENVGYLVVELLY